MSTTATTAVPLPAKALTIPASAPVPASSDPTSIAVAQARRTGTRVEVTSARTENTTTWANPDGTLTTDVAAGPVRVAQGKNLVPVDPTLVLANGKVAPRAAKGDIVLSAGSTTAGAELASLAAGASRFGLHWPGPLPVPTLAGDTATYANVVPDGDLVVKATTMGFEVNLVLRKAPVAAPVIRLPLGLNGLALSQDGKGQLALRDAAGTAVATSAAPVMTSAARDPRADEPTQIRVVATTIETGKSGPELVLRPDFAFLTDPATVYPVTIDPPGQLTSGLSTYVASDYPTTNYDSDPLLKVGTYNGGATKDRSFIRFDDGIIKGNQVTSATLNLYETWAYSCTPTQMWVDGAGVFNPGITWNTQPWVDGRHWNAESFAMGYTGCAAGLKTLDITGLVQAWSAPGAPQDALALLASNENDSYQWKKFSSVNSTNPPTITVNYNPSAPSAPQSVVATPHNASATISWAPPASSGGAPISTYYVYIFTYPGYVYSGYVTACATCTSASVGGVNGQQYQAFVGAYNGTLGPWGLSNVYTEAAPPSVPLNIVATAANGSGTARWSPPASNGGVPVEWYLVVAYDNVGPTQVGGFWVCGTCTSTTYPGLTNGHSYVIAVWADNTPGGLGAPVVSNNISPGATDPLAGAGDRSTFSQQGFSLTDRMGASVNLGTGNLEVAVTDLVLPGIGGSLPLGRVYNSLAPATGASTWFSTAFGYDWRFNQAPDVRLVPNADGSVAYDTPTGNVLLFTPSGSALVAPVGLDATLVRNGGGTYTLTVGGTEVLQFAGDGNLASGTDSNGNVLSFAYPDGRRVTTITSNAGTAPGNTATIDYSGPNGRVAAISVTADGATRTVHYTYDSTGIGLTSVTDAANQVTAYTFDGASNLTQITGPAPISQVTKFAYDASHRVTAVTRVIPGFPDAVTRYDYSTPGHTRVTDPDANPPTDITFFPDGRMNDATDARGSKTVVVWTSALTVSAVKQGVDPNPLLTLVTNLWDALVPLNLTKVTSATGAFLQTGGYGTGATTHQPGWSTDTMGTAPVPGNPGVATTYGYDNTTRGNLTSVTDPLNGLTTIVPNADGTTASVASPANPGNPTTYGYTNHLLTSVAPPTGSSCRRSPKPALSAHRKSRSRTCPMGRLATLP
ncbi:MAG TPA: DNRLRE domain-containing protein [Acidimicrobiales bacterium]|nr:DNRLRE domain-containing protein [Acidimicrobiales bacterium]